MNKRQNKIGPGNLVPLDEESPIAPSSAEEELKSSVPEKELSLLPSRDKPNMGSRRNAFQVRDKSLSKRLINLMESKERSTRTIPTESNFRHNDEENEQNKNNKPRILQGLALSMRSHQKRQLKYRVANLQVAKESSSKQVNRSTKTKGFWALIVKSLDQERVDTHQ